MEVQSSRTLLPDTLETSTSRICVCFEPTDLEDESHVLFLQLFLPLLTVDTWHSLSDNKLCKGCLDIPQVS